MKDFSNTYCNPFPLPDYPIGRCSILEDMEYNWRETADPTVLYENGKWYLYPSCGMVYITENFKDWEFKRIEPYDCGYAPTVCRHKGKYYLCGSLSGLWVSDAPDADFHKISDFLLPDGSPVPYCYDPMLFSDDDGRFYIYYAMGVKYVILAAELDPEEPWKFLHEPEIAISFDPSHKWERNGEHNESGESCSYEGPWMYKKNGIYYLTYCAPATEFSSYGMGAYKGTSPMGPWTYMETSPFTEKRYGVVRGPGHGCVVDGPDDTIWAFYTCTVCYQHPLERRIGMDLLYINENGDLVCPRVTETPQWAPGSVENPVENGDTGLIEVSARRHAKASSCAPGRDAIYAVDDDLLSFWQPAEDDKQPTLEIPFEHFGMNCCAVRILWRDVNLSLRHGNLPGPIQYKLEARDERVDGPWQTVVDRTDSTEDMIVDYRTFAPVRANKVRLTVTGWPKGITPAIMNIAIFAYWTPHED